MSTTARTASTAMRASCVLLLATTLLPSAVSAARILHAITNPTHVTNTCTKTRATTKKICATTNNSNATNPTTVTTFGTTNTTARTTAATIILALTTRSSNRVVQVSE
eukprot:GHVT01048955.1.p2 GENE.GHVT01048955.1~~GHVT01048955.1.p2  ORF type:complete len:108 (-),score=16.33 GHVT01048955.1:928-1251(-)